MVEHCYIVWIQLSSANLYNENLSHATRHTTNNNIKRSNKNMVLTWSPRQTIIHVHTWFERDPCVVDISIYAPHVCLSPRVVRTRNQFARDLKGVVMRALAQKIIERITVSI